MKNHTAYAQLYLRLALGAGFISAVLDRIGWLGPAGQNNVGWGNWQSFLNYTHTLLPFLPQSLSNFCGLLATIAEVVFAVLLIVGFKTRYSAIGSAVLMLFFALAMTASLGLKAPLNYSVFAASAGAFLLAGVETYRWSIDNLKTPANI